jgi:hypothetical protein
MSQVLKEHAIGMVTAGMSTRAVARELNVRFSAISCLQPHKRRPHVWHHVGERFADVNVVNRVPHVGGWVRVWAGMSYGRLTQMHFVYGNFNAQTYRDEILKPILWPIFLADVIAGVAKCLSAKLLRRWNQSFHVCLHHLTFLNL